MHGNRLTIFSEDLRNSNWFFDVLQAAVILQRRRPADVDIFFLPNKSAPGEILRQLKKRWPGVATRQPVARPPEAKGERQSLYERFARGERLTLERPAGTIAMSKVRFPPWQEARLVGAAAAGAARIWREHTRAGGMRALPFLSARFRGVRVGDLATSTFFASEFGRGDVQPHPYLFYTLYETCYLVCCAAELNRRHPHGVRLAITPEPSYIPAAAYRYFYAQGTAAIDVYQRRYVIALVPPSDSPTPSGPRLDVVPREDRRLSDEERRRVDEYFARRLTNARTVLWHMRYGENDNRAADVLDRNGESIALRRDAVYPVVFLHSFADAQYYYGLDDFESLTDWLFFSIDRCLANPRAAKVLIKPHPSESYRGMHTDAIVYERMIQRYGSDDRVHILHPKASLTRLCEAAHIVGMTHHGSVAEELVHLGQPVIASALGPWGRRYRFAKLWSTRAQYAELLAAISFDSWASPSEEEREELVHFIVDERLGELMPEFRFPRQILARLLGGDGGMEEHLDALDRLHSDDPDLALLLAESERLPAYIPPWFTG